MALATKGWLDQPLTLSSATTGRTGTRISPDMVAEDGSMPSHLNPAFVKRQALLHDPPTLPQWAPRAGRNDAFIKWQDALIAAEATLDIDINEQQPQLAHLLANLPLVTTSTVNRQQMDYFVNVTADAADMWQEDSNTLFDVIKASLVLDGPHLERNLRTIASFVSGKLKDARQLRAWALSFADLSSIDHQTKLCELLNKLKLTTDQGYQGLEKHCRDFWKVWSHISGNDASSPESVHTFYVQWLASLPTDPTGHLGSVRKWLADKVTDGSSDLINVDGMIDALLKYARRRA